METIFDSLGQPIYNANGHKGYLIKWKLVTPFCKKWSRNRDADMERVKEMIDLYHKGGYIPRMIHLACLGDEGVVCYDGNHRKEVFNAISEDDDDLVCLVDIIFNATHNDVYKAFNNINKSVQLPAIYIEECNENDVKAEIIELVRQYEVRYRGLMSTSPRCHAPNFNRDTFTDNIYTIYKSYGGKKSIAEIRIVLDKLNEEYAQGKICRPHSMYKDTVIQKCKKHNMWLFLEKCIPIEHVELIHRSLGAC